MPEVAESSPGSTSGTRRRTVSKRGDPGGAMIVPLARGLAVLAAFGGEQRWLRNRDIVRETGIPTATVARLLHSLVETGYLRFDNDQRLYRLTAASLALGYAASADVAAQVAACAEMQKLADAHDTCVVLGTRDRLDVVVLESWAARSTPYDLRRTVSMRRCIGASAMGRALLATLPEAERAYLQGNLERKTLRNWPALRRGIAEGVSQVSALGFCTARNEWKADLVSVAVPVRVTHHAPLALACIGSEAQMGRARIERELGPRLVNVAQALQERMLNCENSAADVGKPIRQ
ncbi:IclR family transcriptional regulator [Cupriavidus numazuensis]|uniref:HTH-type transcriptional regulator TsaQ1/TsaQ2 n=1 Tax=Cupriavidus numazuensis TaxID=221992 RepID=A0ABM8TLV1_9BURK|nr:IclR family transcriptional regulator [Cupriavidus numazuensis]CAG2153775.1 HTH-type transcriptional regulator TsaQ1/TsaQ2 [Cupriavidus numazuensis]